MNNNNEIEKEQCALLFIGLPRSFQTMVLPSIQQNILEPNVRYQCDVFVHFYKQDSEPKGRMNSGGIIDYEEIFLLENATKQVSLSYQSRGKSNNSTRRIPKVEFIYDTPESFNETRWELLKKYREETFTIVGNNKKNVTFAKYSTPERFGNFTEQIVTNMIKQWHSIEQAFHLMESQHSENNNNNKKYSRVGIFRSDVMFMTPIDIYDLGLVHNSNSTTPSTFTRKYDGQNEYFVTPAFCMYPVNDRMIYGPYEAVKIWATKRFEHVEQKSNAFQKYLLATSSSSTQPNNNNNENEKEKIKNIPKIEILHPESLLKTHTFPAMQKLEYKGIFNEQICFLRTRPGNRAILGDCWKGLLSTTTTMTMTTTTHWNLANETEKQLAEVKSLIGKECRYSRSKEMLNCGSRKERIIL